MTDDKEGSPSSSPYEGRWVARLQGRIIAHGGTAEQALLAAQTIRHKEKPDISYMDQAASLFFPPLIDQVRSALPDTEIYLVGGAVRDALLGIESHDFDFAVQTNAIALARRVASALNADFYVLDESYDVARVIVSNATGTRDFLDFSSYRKAELSSFPQKELITTDEKNDVSKEEYFTSNELYRDLHGRDFTVNALAMDMRDHSVHDPLGGGSDLRRKIIRACSSNTFVSDPIRILRAVRQAAAFGFSIEAETRAAMKRSTSLLTKVSPERQRDELFKILAGTHPAACLRAIEILGVLPYLMPELPGMKGVHQSLPHIYDVWEHTLSVIENLEKILDILTPGFDATKSNDILTGLLSERLGRFREKFGYHFAKQLNADRSIRSLLIFAALYHDVSKPSTISVDQKGHTRFLGHDRQGASVGAERARDFKLSNDEIHRIEVVIANHMRFHYHVSRMVGESKSPSRKAIYRYFRDTREAGVDLMLLGLADLRGMRGTTVTQDDWMAALDVARIFLENYWEKPEESVTPPLLADGIEIMQTCALEEGPLVGEVLNAIQEAQAMGKVTTRLEALEFAVSWLKDHSH